MAKGEVRGRMVSGAVRLLAQRGLDGTSFAEVLELVDAPRGSTYHHFPGGKRELVDAAITQASDRALAALEPARGQSAEDVVGLFLGLWRQLLVYSDLRAGCAVVAVVVATDDDDLLGRAGEIFGAWRGQMTSLLVEGGIASDVAPGLAALVIAAAEGAVAVARAERSMDPFELAAAQLMTAVRDRSSA